MLTMPEQSLEERDHILHEARLAYLILYVNDLEQSRDFYERQLGLRVIEADEDSVKYDTGQVMLLLNRASDYGITLAGRRDDSTDVVFLADDINAVRQDLENRGVVFVRRRTYEVGLVTDFYDPDGHRLMIYQPSPEALSWPSGEKIRQIWRAFGKGGTSLIGPSSINMAENGQEAGSSGLDGKPLIYLFMYVPNSDEAFAYYRDCLGLKEMELVHCSNPSCPPEEMGVVKYDVGGMLLSTHHIHKTFVVQDFGKIYSPRGVDPANNKGIVPVLLVSRIGEVVARLSGKGVDFPDGIIRSQIGSIAIFQTSTGHTFYLYEPSTEALKWPSGAKIRQILASS